MVIASRATTIQPFMLNGTQLNILPIQSNTTNGTLFALTMHAWTAIMIKKTFKKSGFSFNRLNIPKPSSRTLNPLNNALSINNTKYPVKCCCCANTLYCPSTANNCLKNGSFKYKKLITTNHTPITPICIIICGLTILSSRRRGFSFKYFSSAGSFPSIIAPSPSITRLTNKRCVTFNGSSTPKNGATALIITAAILITSWKRQNFKILW